MAALQPLAAEAADREGGDMAREPGPRVLLGNLGPIMRLGMNRVLSEEGCQVVGQEDRPSAIVGAAHRLRPDVVVLDLDGGSSNELAQLVRGASPETTVVLWAREEDLMEVLEPASSASRLVSAPIVERLRGELSSQQHVHE
jgi:DNA-binding NarL/FixJ family response regulator